MKILVTGGAGYVGTTLVPLLLENGHDVTVLDRFFFGKETIEKFQNVGRLSLIRDDIRWFDGKLLEGMDAVVDMAALSNDPAGELDPWKTFEINYLGRSRVARLAKLAGVKRYLLTSSCSIYGFQGGLITEESNPNPLTTYARANLLAEEDNLMLGDSNFVSTAVRFATLYGLSGRMRFDLAINGMVLGAMQNGKIPVMRDGKQWRPFMSVRDAARAVLRVLNSEPNIINGQVFNIGSDSQNYTISNLAEIVASSLSSQPLIEWYGDPDARSYKVSFAKARSILGFETMTTPNMAAKEIEAAIIRSQIPDMRKTNTLGWYKYLREDGHASGEVLMRGIVL